MSLLQAVPASVLWLVVFIRLIGLWYKWKPGILLAASLEAMGATLNIDQVYLTVDHFFGDRNLLNLIVHLLMGAGMTELSRLLLQATERPGQHAKALLGTGVVLVMVQMALLLVSDTGGSATNFTEAFTANPSVALYSASFFSWIGIVLGYTGLECFRRDKSKESKALTIGLDIVSAGCLAGVSAVGAKMLLIGFELAEAGSDDVDILYLAYRVFTALAVAGFAVGFLLPACARAKAAFPSAQQRARDLNNLRPVVRRLAKTTSGKNAKAAARLSLYACTSESQLYRWFIFSGDIRVLDAALLSEQERALIDEIGQRFEDKNNSETRDNAAVGL